VPIGADATFIQLSISKKKWMNNHHAIAAPCCTHASASKTHCRKKKKDWPLCGPSPTLCTGIQVVIILPGQTRTGEIDSHSLHGLMKKGIKGMTRNVPCEEQTHGKREFGEISEIKTHKILLREMADHAKS